MNRHVLVTGAGGFVGRAMASRLLGAGYRVTGIGRGDRPSQLPADAAWRTVDLTRNSEVKRVDGDWWAVVHLASNSIPQRFNSTADILGNVAMTIELLERLTPCRFLFASSCQVYQPGPGLLSETSPTQPPGRYGMSKLLCEQAVLACGERYDVRIARPFNHLGPGMVPVLAIPSLVRRLCAERKSRAPLRMRGQNSIRDFIDVEDVVSAYMTLIELDNPSERVFNVCTGIARSIGEIADIALKLVGSTRTVEFENVKLSSDDSQQCVGDPSRIMRLTDWRPRHTLEESVNSMLNEACAPIRARESRGMMELMQR